MPTPSHQLHNIVFDPIEVYKEPSRIVSPGTNISTTYVRRPTAVCTLLKETRNALMISTQKEHFILRLLDLI